MYRSIVVGTDGSQSARIATERAIELARTVGARLMIVSAYEPRGEAAAGLAPPVPADPQWTVHAREETLALLAQAAAAASAAGLDAVETFARQGDAADAIIDVAEEREGDLIVVGNRGLAGARRFLLGSVPNRVSHHAPCSVLIVRTR
jgi:nucleotide-binding universal stress UspA family protein